VFARFGETILAEEAFSGEAQEREIRSTAREIDEAVIAVRRPQAQVRTHTKS
jgi:hypothetical protein